MAIDVKQLRYAYSAQDDAVKPCSFVLEDSSITVVLGSNGCGKSTLLKLLSRDLQADSGQITIDNCDLKQFTLEELARKRAVLPQQSEQHFAFPVLVKELLLLACYKKPGTEKIHEEMVREVSHLLELESLLLKNYQHLSGGEKQRVQVARVLIQIWPDVEQIPLQQQAQPQHVYLLLDEPCSALDMYHSHQLLTLLKQFCSRGILNNTETRLSCFIVLHEINLALKYADNILLMKSGNLLAQGKVTEVLTQENIQNAFAVRAKLHFSENRVLEFIETGL